MALEFKFFKNRDWSGFFGNVLKALSPTLLIGIGIALLIRMWENNYAFFGGWSLIVLGIVLAIFLAVPKKQLNPDEYLCEPIKLDQVDSFFPRLKKIHLAGLSYAGKSTFATFMRFNEEAVKTSTKTVVHIVKSRKSHIGHFGILDGAGDDFNQQFEMLKVADIMILFLDHTELMDEKSISQDRLRETEKYQRQLKNKLANRKKLDKILIILNKQDLFEGTDQAVKNELNDWFLTQVSEWKNSNLAESCVHLVHSNFQTKDFVKLVNNIEV